MLRVMPFAHFQQFRLTAEIASLIQKVSRSLPTRVAACQLLNSLREPFSENSKMVPRRVPSRVWSARSILRIRCCPGLGRLAPEYCKNVLTREAVLRCWLSIFRCPTGVTIVRSPEAAPFCTTRCVNYFQKANGERHCLANVRDSATLSPMHVCTPAMIKPACCLESR